MKVVAGGYIPEQIAGIIHDADQGDEVYIVSSQVIIRNAELMNIWQTVQHDAKVKIISGSPFDAISLNKLAKIYNVSCFEVKGLRSNVYLNKKEGLVTTCTYSQLHIMKYMDIGILVTTRDSMQEMNRLREFVTGLLHSAKNVLPMLPFKPSQVDLGKILEI